MLYPAELRERVVDSSTKWARAAGSIAKNVGEKGVGRPPEGHGACRNMWAVPAELTTSPCTCPSPIHGSCLRDIGENATFLAYC